MLILIGQAPSQHKDPHCPLEGRVMRQLAKLFGCSEEEYLRKTQRFNVVPVWPGKIGKGDRFPSRLARINASRMQHSFGGCHVLFVGIQTARSFLSKGPILTWRKSTVPDTDIVYRSAILPHPSGVNRWWNKLSNRRKASGFMRATWHEII